MSSEMPFPPEMTEFLREMAKKYGDVDASDTFAVVDFYDRKVRELSFQIQVKLFQEIVEMEEKLRHPRS